MEARMCSPLGCRYCIGSFCLKHGEPLENDIKKTVMFHAFCSEEYDVIGQWRDKGLKPGRPGA